MKPLVAVVTRPFVDYGGDYKGHRNPVNVITALKEASLFFDKIAAFYVTWPLDGTEYASVSETVNTTLLIEKAHLWYDWKRLKINPIKHPRACEILESMVERDPQLLNYRGLPPPEKR